MSSAYLPRMDRKEILLKDIPETSYCRNSRKLHNFHPLICIALLVVFKPQNERERSVCQLRAWKVNI